MKRADIVAEARTWLDTPFMHQGRFRGKGIDCAGLIEMVPRALGAYTNVPMLDVYKFQPNPLQLRATMDTYLDKIGFKYILPADILLLRVTYAPQHLALVTELNPMKIIHVTVRRCEEHELNDYWRQRVEGCYRYRELED